MIHDTLTLFQAPSQLGDSQAASLDRQSPWDSVQELFAWPSFEGLVPHPEATNSNLATFTTRTGRFPVAHVPRPARLLELHGTVSK